MLTNQAERWVEVGNDVIHVAGTELFLFRCPDCAALVLPEDTQRHEHWHARLTHPLRD